ncbi:S1 family peptidase [Vibrio viridaestus]|uniref:Peptidase S1 domain-containing protein n=1 Tax=Vibrio viridaestus TaxID=2487322 RepID=A0A3N9U329_9VIBR|nr:trypsin-like serine protease [Vibrio viridaestus]RQW63982.1 hypothetical protein EES38_05090 [Vibrio viridaestus]
MRVINKYLLFIFLASFLPLKSEASVINAILNGTVTSLSVIPYQVKLTILRTSGSETESVLCGGSIIDDSLILTAAHCVEDDGGYTTSSITVRYLDYTDSSSPTITSASVSSFTINPSWTGSVTNSSDIAVLYSANTFANAKKIKIASTSEISTMLSQFLNSYAEGQDNEENVQASGYGIDENDSYDVLKRVLLTGIPSATCNSLKSSSDTGDDVICVQSPSQTTDYGFCSGDSGGPLVWQNPSNSSDSDYGVRLIGVASYVTAENGNCRLNGTGYFGAYTNINYYKSFVNSAASSLTSISGYDYENLSISYSFDSNPILASNSTSSSVTTSSSGGGTTTIPIILSLFSLLMWRSYKLYFRTFRITSKAK